MPEEYQSNSSSDGPDELLAVAALFEGTFSLDWILEVTGQKATRVLLMFEQAVQSGDLRKDEIGYFAFPENRRRKWRDRLKPGEKQRYYPLIARMLKKELPDSDTKAETISPYLLQIDNDLNGCKQLIAAGNRFLSSFQEEKALQCYSKILDDLAGMSGREIDSLFCDTAVQYAKLTTARHKTDRVLAVLEDAMVRAVNLGDYRHQSLLNMHFAKNKWLQSQYDSAVAHFENAWAIAGDLADEQLIRATGAFKTFFLFWQGRFKEAVRDYEKRVPDVEKYPHGRYPLLATMTIGTCYGKIGQVTQGIGMIDAVRRYCLEQGDNTLAAHSGICMGAIMLDNGYISEAFEYLTPCGREAKTSPPDWTVIQGELVLAYAYYRAGKIKLSAKYLKQYLAHSQGVQVSARTWAYFLELCWAVENEKLPQIPGVSITAEIKAMLCGRNIFLKGAALRYACLLQKKQGADAETINDLLMQSLECLKTSGHAVEMSKTRLELARHRLSAGDEARAVAIAEPAFKALGETNQSLIPDDLHPLFRRFAASDPLSRDMMTFIDELTDMKTAKTAVRHIISAANRFVGAERGGVFSLNGPGRTGNLELRASKNLTREHIEPPDFAPSIALMEEVVRTGLGRRETVSKDLPANISPGETILSKICVPILSRQKVIGLLYHDNRLLNHAFNDAHLKILSFFASHVAIALHNDRLRRENRRMKKRLRDLTAHYEQQHVLNYKDDVDAIIGESNEIKQVLAQVREVAATHANVLILGETGTGKGVLANVIQRNSDRKEKPFITLNCNALSEALIYSELFGHEKGAFTGAEHRHIGRFEKVNGGTLFLDEIGDLPLDLQVRLLRVIETKQFERVGGTRTLQSDFRLITATNRNLTGAIEEKMFRKDLFYRINVFSIYIPPLRERKEDIPLLVHHFLKLQSMETGKVVRPVSDTEMSALKQYHWPGNVRELKNMVERYVVSGSNAETSIADMIDRTHRISATGRQAITLKENERQHIRWALKKTNGKLHGPGGAAELLDIHPNTLRHRMKKLGIDK